MIPMVLSRLIFILFRTKVSQYLKFIRIMSGAVNETSFRFALQVIYIFVLALASALSCRGVILRRGVLSSLLDAVTITFVICPGRFLIRNFYYTFLNIFYDFHTLKHINSLFKRNGFAIKSLNIGFFRPAVSHDV